jgi:undecaprenyl-diphosphatase
MHLWYTLLKGALQGLTEFLPVSSSAHLVLFDVLTHRFGWLANRPNVVVEEFFDILLHLGTLAAVVIYFRREVLAVIKRLPQALSPRARQIEAQAVANNTPPTITTDDGTAWLSTALIRGLLISFVTTAVVSVGVVKASAVVFAQLGWASPQVQDITQFYMANPLFIAAHLMLTGVLLWVAEGIKPPLTANPQAPLGVSSKQALVIGVFQAVAAIFRGISRSGSTIAAALLVGLTRQQAARYSFLLSVPIFIAAFAYEGLKLTSHHLDLAQLPWLAMLAGVLASAVVGYACIAGFMQLISRVSLRVFSVYCWVAGIGLIWLFTH